MISREHLSIINLDTTLINTKLKVYNLLICTYGLENRKPYE